MKRFAQIYNDIDSFKDYLDKCDITSTSKCLVKIFTSDKTEEEALDLAKKVKEILPFSEIVGASSPESVIYSSKSYVGKTVIVVDKYEKAKIQVKFFDTLLKSPENLAKEIHEFYFCNNKQNAVVDIIFSGEYIDGHNFCLELDKLTPFLKICGGVSGATQDLAPKGFIFSDKGVFADSVLTFTANSLDIDCFVKSVSSVEVLSPVFEVTESDGIYIEMIENTPALAFMCEFLGISEDDLVDVSDLRIAVETDILAHFPLVLENSDNCARFSRYDSTNNKLALHHSNLPKGTKFRFGYVNADKITKENHNICEDVLDTPLEYLFVYSCFLRRAYMRGRIDFELSPFAKYNVCGIFTMGEFATDGKRNFYYNGARIMYGLGENENYLIPNLQSLDELPEITKEFQFTNRIREQIKERFESRFALTLKYGNIDKHKNNLVENFNIYNYYQYEEDHIKYNFRNLVVAEVLTADTTIAFAGEQAYYSSAREVLSEVRDYLDSHALIDKLRIYSLNHKTFLLGATAEFSSVSFIEQMRKLHELYEYPTAKSTGISSVVRFAVITDSDDLVQAGLNALLQNKDNQDNFIFCEQSQFSQPSLTEESFVINLLTHAITHNRVVPYYQGIHNNKTSKIDKYEALMRIVDENGKVYTPNIFLDIAKRYKFYNRISQMMIDKVLEDFRDREETVSVNISLFDIKSPNFRNWLLGKLERYPNPKKIIIEFVETENYQDLDVLFDFVGQIKHMGSNIAIDDFGAGYSTFSTIVALSPDFIKIDGNIIGKLSDSPDNIVILNTIRYLANQMKTETVAEFVENVDIQEIVKLNDVSHSQGYYFSKPLPFNKLELL